jgi:hypothetical protein
MPVADQPSLAPAVFHSPVLWERANGTVGSTDVCHGDARLVIEANHAPARITTPDLRNIRIDWDFIQELQILGASTSTAPHCGIPEEHHQYGNCQRNQGTLRHF